MRAAQHTLFQIPPPLFPSSLTRALPSPIAAALSSFPSLPSCALPPSSALLRCCPAALLPAAALPLACGLCWRDWSELSPERPGWHARRASQGSLPFWGGNSIVLLVQALRATSALPAAAAASLCLLRLLPPSLPPSLPRVPYALPPFCVHTLSTNTILSFPSLPPSLPSLSCGGLVS